MNKSKVISSLVFKFVERLAAKGIGLIISIILARLLAPEIFGLVAIISVFVNLAQTFVQSGLGTALVQNRTADETDYSTVFYLSTGIAVLMIAILFAVAPLVGQYYGDNSLIWPLRVYSLSLLVGALNSVQNAKMQREMQFKVMMRCNLIATVISGAICVVAAFWGAGLWALVIYYSSNQGIVTVCMLAAQQWYPKWAFSIKRAKELFGFGWKMLVSALLCSLYNDIRALIIGKKYSTEDLAYYNKGQQFPDILANTMDVSIQTVMLPVMSSAQDSPEQLNKILRKTLTLSMFVVAPVMFGLASVADTLIPLLLTEKWSASIPLMYVFCFSSLTLPIMTTNLSVLKALGRSDVYMRTELMRRVVMIAVLLTTVFCFDSVMVIAIGFALNSWLDAYIIVRAIKKLTGIGWLKQLVWCWKSLLAGGIMAVAVFAMNVLPIAVFGKLVLQILTGATIYILLSAVLKNEMLFEALEILKSSTMLLPTGLLILMFVQHYLEYNHSNAAQYLLSRNEVPFFKASLISAGGVLVLLMIFVVWLDMGVSGMILAPMLVQAVYQNWKWPLEVIKEFRI